MANIKFDNNAKTATITINPKAKWSDGQPVTSRDVEFTYEIIANKDSNSTNYTDDMDDIIGLKAYHEGKASSISGLETPNDRTLIIHFKEMRPSMKTAGNSYIVPDAQPYHYLKDIPISKLASSDRYGQSRFSMAHSRSKRSFKGNQSNGFQIHILGKEAKLE